MKIYNKKYVTIILIFSLLLSLFLSGCASDNVSANSVSNQPVEEKQGPVTMAEEISQDISENAIPEEAMKYTSLSFNIPDGMVADKDNTETKAFYLSEATNDLSFVGYQRKDNSGKISYDTMSREDFEAAFYDQLGVEPQIQAFVKEVKDEYFKIKVGVIYSVAGINYTCTEYIYVTNDYIFTLTYCQDARCNWLNSYKESAESVELVSVVAAVKDSDVVGEIVEDMVADELSNSVSEASIVSDNKKTVSDN